MEIYVPTDSNALNSADQLYDIPVCGNVSLLHFTDCHAQLLPIYYREPAINLGVGSAEGKVPHLVGAALLHAYGIKAGSRQAYAFSHLDFCAAARAYGKVGGFAHLATLVKRMKASRYRPTSPTKWRAGVWAASSQRVSRCGMWLSSILKVHR